MQSKDELETWYETVDPWKYETTHDDLARKQIIIDAIKQYCGYPKSLLDIGAGEGFITKDIPAERLYAIEISDIASSRLPDHIKRIHEPEEHDCILTCGTLYKQYDHETIARWLKTSKKYIVVAGIKDWLIPYDFGNLIFRQEFPYRQYTQQLSIYEVTPQHRDN